MGSIPIRHPVQVAEWSNAEVCKTSITVGSNPTLNSKKLDWCNGSTTVSKTVSGSSNLSSFAYALVTQWLEYPPSKRLVVGSNPTEGALSS
jgi:hypothetical protein